ncbi:MAG: trehalose-phosphatase, partial [Chloroflexota bacterium]|nr:trehalose-phosphatase [Chloroflexota bacterium]
MRHEPAGLATDYDGTLSEITANRGQALPAAGIRETLQRLVRRLAVVAVITGRPASEIAGFLDIEELTYIGNHGSEWLMNGKLHLLQLSASAQAELEMARHLLAPAISGMDGVELESKRTGLALHYRSATFPRS